MTVIGEGANTYKIRMLNDQPVQTVKADGYAVNGGALVFFYDYSPVTIHAIGPGAWVDIREVAR